MNTAEKIVNVSLPFVDKFFAEVGSRVFYDIDKTSTMRLPGGGKKSGKFLILRVKYRRPDGQFSTIQSQVIYEFAATESLPSETELKRTEAILLGTPTSMPAPRPGAAPPPPPKLETPISQVPAQTLAQKGFTPVSDPSFPSGTIRADDRYLIPEQTEYVLIEGRIYKHRQGPDWFPAGDYIQPFPPPNVDSFLK